MLFRKHKKDDKLANEDMIAWARSLAHEIKNPLNIMRINLQLLQEEMIAHNVWTQQNKEDESLRKLDTLNKEVDRLEAILNDFMRFVRLPKPNPQRHNLYILLNELLDFTEPESQQLNIEVIRDFDTALPEIDIDDVQIKQALLNIILNANQAMRSGGRLIVKTYRTNGSVAIDITDTGEGMPPERINRIFELFYSTKEDGTGVGLAISRRIVNLHGGKIQVKSEEGKGSTFSMLLPIHHKSE